MKTFTRSILYVSVFAILALASCKKDDDPTPAVKTKTDLLTQNTWKFSAALPANDLGAQIIGIFYADSEKTFKKDLTYSELILGLTGSGKWEFAESETKIVLDKGESTEQNFKINKLDETSLELIIIDPDNTTEITLQYVKK